MIDYGKRLEEWFQQHPKVLVALSGGVDSCLVAFLARQMNGKESAISLIGVSPSLKKRDLQMAESFCDENDIEYHHIHPNLHISWTCQIRPEEPIELPFQSDLTIKGLLKVFFRESGHSSA